jgi:hypothetical protein
MRQLDDAVPVRRLGVAIAGVVAAALPPTLTSTHA